MNTRRAVTPSNLLDRHCFEQELSRLIARKAGAWEAFREAFEGSLYAAARAAIRGRKNWGGYVNSEDMEEIVQDVYARLLREECRALKTYDPRKGAPKTWLRRLTRNVAINRLKRPEIQTVPLSETLDVAVSEPERADLIAAAVECLSKSERTVLRLLFDGGLSSQAAAKLLGISVGAVYVRKWKGINRLRVFLASPPPRTDATPAIRARRPR